MKTPGPKPNRPAFEAEADGLIAQIQAIVDFDEAASALGEMLALGAPTPPEVTARFLSDAAFAKTLVSTRAVPAWRDQMLQDPKNALFTVPVTQAKTPTARPAKSIAAQALKAANAYIKWGEDGFTPAPDDVQQKRRAACLDCEHLRPAQGLVQSLVARTAKGGSNKICAMCGCPFERKVSMPAERCPIVSEADPMKTRWGDPVIPE